MAARGDGLGLYAATTSVSYLSPTPDVIATLHNHYSDHGTRAYDKDERTRRETSIKWEQQMNCTKPSDL